MRTLQKKVNVDTYVDTLLILRETQRMLDCMSKQWHWIKTNKIKWAKHYVRNRWFHSWIVSKFGTDGLFGFAIDLSSLIPLSQPKITKLFHNFNKQIVKCSQRRNLHLFVLLAQRHSHQKQNGVWEISNLHWARAVTTDRLSQSERRPAALRRNSKNEVRTSRSLSLSY